MDSGRYDIMLRNKLTLQLLFITCCSHVFSQEQDKHVYDSF